MKQTEPKKIQSQGYKHICPFCKCDENGPSCKKKDYIWGEDYGQGLIADYWSKVDGTRCSFYFGILCSYYKKNHFPKLKSE